MIATPWKNGSLSPSEALYGLQLEGAECDRFFQGDREIIELEFEGYAQVVKVEVSKPAYASSACRALVHAEIGRWLIDNGLDAWQLSQPPKLSLKYIGGNRFRLTK